MICSPESIRKTERIQERALRILHDNFESSYETLLSYSNKTSFLIRQHKNLALEIYKTLNDLNPSYMKEIFHLNDRRENSRRPNNILIPKIKAYTYGENSLNFVGPKIWNSLPENVKGAKSLFCFKKLLKSWNGENCSCRMCGIFRDKETANQF